MEDLRGLRSDLTLYFMSPYCWEFGVREVQIEHGFKHKRIYSRSGDQGSKDSTGE